MASQKLLLSTLLKHYEPYEEILFTYFQGIHLTILLRKWRLNYQQELDAEMRKLKTGCKQHRDVAQTIYHMMKAFDIVKNTHCIVISSRYEACSPSYELFIPVELQMTGLQEFECLVVWIFSCVEWFKKLQVQNHGIEFSKLVEMYISPLPQFVKFQERFQGGTKTLIKLEDIMAFLQYATSVASLFIVICRMLAIELDENAILLITVDMNRKSDIYYQLLNPDKSIPLRTHYKKILAPCSQVDLVLLYLFSTMVFKVG